MKLIKSITYCAVSGVRRHEVIKSPPRTALALLQKYMLICSFSIEIKFMECCVSKEDGDVVEDSYPRLGISIKKRMYHSFKKKGKRLEKRTIHEQLKENKIINATIWEVSHPTYPKNLCTCFHCDIFKIKYFLITDSDNVKVWSICLHKHKKATRSFKF